MGLRGGIVVFNLFQEKQYLVGIDIGRSAVKTVQLKDDAQGIRLIYAGIKELPMSNGTGHEQVLIDTLVELLKAGGIKKERVATVVSAKPPAIRYLTLPKMPKEELAEAVKWETKKLITTPLEELIIDFLILGEMEERGSKKYELLLVAADRQAVLNHLSIFKKAGVDVAVIDVNPLAILKTFKKGCKIGEKENVIFVDIGAGQIDISIFKDGSLRFNRNIVGGGNEITKAIEKNLGFEYREAEELKRLYGLSDYSKPQGNKVDRPLSSDEDGKRKVADSIKPVVDRIILEIQRSIDYYKAQFREGAVSKIILTGGVSLMPGLLEYFSMYFEIEVSMDNPFQNLRCDDDLVRDLILMAPRFSTSVGLALRRLGE